MHMQLHHFSISINLIYKGVKKIAIKLSPQTVIFLVTLGWCFDNKPLVEMSLEIGLANLLTSDGTIFYFLITDTTFYCDLRVVECF